MKNLDTREATQITNIINKFLADNGFELDVSLGTDFAYYHASSHITYALAVSDRFANTFKAFCHSIDSSITADIFILSLFHEIGHNLVCEEIDDETASLDQEKKRSISLLMEDCTEREAQILVCKYYSLPTEIIATVAGLEYIKGHEAEVRKLWNDILPHIMRFYHDNNVTEIEEV